MDGILIIDKPVDWTSHDVVAKLRKILKTKRIGHTGTLDPFATGVLVMLVGKATRLAQFLDKDRKEYLAAVRFGSETDTGDGTGELRITNYELRNISGEDIEKVLPGFRGEISQTPPMYSAKKVDGKKLYDLARQGIEIERKPINIKIYELEIVEGQESRVESLEPDQRPLTTGHTLRVACSAGTYIRTLAEDIGRKLEIGAHLAALRRTHAGKFDLSKALTLETLEKIVSENKLDEFLIPMNQAISNLSQIILDESEAKKILHGMSLKVSDESEFTEFVRVCDTDENLLAIGFFDAENCLIKPRIVFAENS